MSRRIFFFPQVTISIVALRRLLLLSTIISPKSKSKSKSSDKSMELKSIVIKRTLQENAIFLEKEKTEIPDTKRCKIQHDEKKSVNKRSTSTSGDSSTVRSTNSSKTITYYSIACLDTRSVWSEFFDHGQKILLWVS